MIGKVTYNKKRGAASLITVLILAAGASLLTFGSMFLSIGELEMGYLHQKGVETLAIAEGCLELVNVEILQDENYGIGSGVFTITTPSGSCDIDITEPSPGNRNINILANTDVYFKRLESTIEVLSDNLNLLTWSELES